MPAGWRTRCAGRAARVLVCVRALACRRLRNEPLPAAAMACGGLMPGQQQSSAAHRGGDGVRRGPPLHPCRLPAGAGSCQRICSEAARLLPHDGGGAGACWFLCHPWWQAGRRVLLDLASFEVVRAHAEDISAVLPLATVCVCNQVRRGPYTQPAWQTSCTGAGLASARLLRRPGGQTGRAAFAVARRSWAQDEAAHLAECFESRDAQSPAAAAAAAAAGELGAGGHPALSAAEAAGGAWLASRCRRMAVVTLGGRGCAAFFPSNGEGGEEARVLHVPAVAGVRAVDTTGAGGEALLSCFEARGRKACRLTP